MIDALRSYLQLASGFVEATASKAKESAASLISQGLESGAPEISAQVTEIAEDLLEQSRTNRELLLGLIRTEIDRNIGRMGFVREEELAAVRKHVLRLEQELVTRSGQATGLASAAVNTAASAGNAILDAASVAAASAANSAAGVAKAAQPRAARPKQPPADESHPAPSHAAVPVGEAPVKKAPARKSSAGTAVKKAPAKKAPSKAATVPPAGTADGGSATAEAE